MIAKTATTVGRLLLLLTMICTIGTPPANAQQTPMTFISLKVFTPIQFGKGTFILAASTSPRAGVWIGVTEQADLDAVTKAKKKSFSSCEVQSPEDKERLMNALMRVVAELPIVELGLQRGATKPTAEQIEGITILRAAREFLNSTSRDPWYLCV